MRAILVAAAWAAAIVIPLVFDVQDGAAWLAWLLAAAAFSVFALRSDLGRGTFVSLSTALLALLAVEGYLAWTAPAEPWFEGDFESVYYVDHRDLGYGPQPGGTYRAHKLLGDTTIYDVTYTIDDTGLRRIPDQPPNAPCAVAFFGGSVTFGEGLEDSQSMPDQVAAQSAGRLRVHNFGFHGYGPHQMLRALETPLAHDAAGRKLDAIVYQGIEAHVERSAGKVPWDLYGPRYRAGGDGLAIHEGPFHGQAYRSISRALRGWRLFHFFETRVLASGQVTETDFDTYRSILRSARRLARDKFGGDLIILFWDQGSGSRYAARLVADLKADGHRLVPVSAIIPDIGSGAGKYVISDLDPHPSALVNRRIGEHMAKMITAERCRGT
ncbi:MAG: hypothetical protein H6907_02475 [Hyphomicrobiales bacterium]|nr:hypothetical protein [Hyphomicrobiales bacterium]